MKKFLIGFVVVATFVVLGFLVFTTEFSSVDSLIRPPKIEGENREIQTAFETAVGEKYVLKSPLSGEYRTSFIRTNIDNDSIDEVVVFYCLSDVPDVIRMNILDENNGQWESVADLESSYNDIYQIQFADIDNDNCKEFIVCWRNFETEITNKLDIYKLSENESKSIETVFSKNCYRFLVFSADNTEQNDILVFEKGISNASNEIKGVYYNFLNSTPNILGEFTLDPTINSIGAISSSVDTDTNLLKIYIDGYKSDSNMTTDLVYWNSDTNYFEKPLLHDSTSIPVVSSRNININCTDIDNNSVINIPIEQYLPESSVISVDSEGEIQQQAVIEWAEYDSYYADFNISCYEILNAKYGYSLFVEPENYKKITIENDTTNGTMTFFELLREDDPKKEKKPKKKDEPFDDREPEKDNGKTSYRKGEVLFSVFATGETDYGTYEFSGYKLLDSANGFNYYCHITEYGKELGITREMIKANFNT